MIKLINVNKSYKENVLKDISFEFKSHGLYFILGPSGSGKSTLLNLISGVSKNYIGKIQINNIDIKNLNKEELDKFRLKNIGYVFQDFKLLNSLTVKDNILFNIDATYDFDKLEQSELLNKSLEFVNLKNKENKTINKLSGGEKQRVAIARSIISEPNILLCDEPTGNLDYKNSINIFNILKEYSKNHLVIVVSHDVELTYKYADIVLNLSDGKINKIEKINEIDDNEKPYKIYQEKRRKIPNLFFLLRCGYNKIKEKKYRTILTNFISSVSLLTLGLSLIISNSLNDQIVSSFKSVINPNQIIVTRKNDNPNTYNSFLACDADNVNSIMKQYKEEILDIGVEYCTDISTIFVDNDYLFFTFNNQKYNFTNYHSNLFMNYIWKDELFNTTFYPNIVGELNENELILGVTYEDMINMCLIFHIEKTYEALGEFIKAYEIEVTLDLSNESWEYYKLTKFKLCSVYPSVIPSICHTNHRFNEFLFEKELQMQTTDDFINEPYYPWTLKKVYTIHTYEAPYNLIEKVSLNRKFDDLIFERKENFINDKCILTDDCDQNIIYVFICDKNSIPISRINDFKNKVPSIKNYYFTTQNGYMMHSSGMVSGFLNNIGFSFDLEKINSVAEYFESHIEGDVENINGVAFGSINKANDNGVSFDSNLENIIEGDKPNNYNEIVISTGLVKYLEFNYNPIYQNFYYTSYNYELETSIINKFKIVGLIDNEKNVLYHNPLFTISFFQNKLGLSAFSLLPINVVLNVNEKSDINKSIEILNTNFKEFNFESPLLEIKKTVDNVMQYVSLISRIFAIVSSIIAIILFCLISYLNLIDNKEDLKLLFIQGHNKKTIILYMISNSLIYSIVSTIISMISLYLMQFIFSFTLAKILGSEFVFSISIFPFILILILGLLIPITISYLVTKFYIDYYKIEL